jgi:PucR family transcriptional regulator, purine catabolism regulatory protein
MMMVMIRLSELLARRELGLHAAFDAPDAEVVHAEVCDLPDPRPWLETGTLLLSTGVGLGHGAHGQRLFVERAAQSGTAAIGFAVGLAHAAIPPAIAEECERLELPLVVVPPGTPFRLLVEAVGERSAPFQLQTAQRGLSIQSYLMEAVAAAEPEAEVLRRLGSLLSGTALVADESGAVEGAPAAALPEQLWGPLRGSKGVALHHLRGRRYVTAPVADRAGLRRWIVVVGDPGALPDQLARQALQAGERLVRLIDRARPPRPAEARAVRAELAKQLLGFRTAPERRLLIGRVEALGLRVESGLQVAVLRSGEHDGSRESRSQDAARVLAEVEARLSGRDLAFLLVQRDDDVVIIAGRALEETLRAIVPELAQTTTERLLGGVGRVVVTLEALSRSLLDARFAAEQLRDRKETGSERPDGWEVLSHAELDLATALVCDADPAIAGPRRAALLGRVATHELRQTLLAYLEHDLDIRRTAQSLHLHANSLRYRLGRIEEQLGLSLRHPSTIANLHLALLLERGGGAAGAPTSRERTDDSA